MNYDVTLQMFTRVSETLEKNLSKWDGIAALREFYDEFMKNYVKIKKLSEKQNKRPATLMKTKDKLMEKLAEKAVPVANVLEVFTAGTGKKNVKPVKINKNKLLKSKDTVILKKCDQILRNSRNLFNKAMKDTEMSATPTSVKNISDYGLTEKMIDELEDSFSKFKSESDQVGNILKQEKKSAEKINKLVRKNSKLLQKKLDKLMVLFESRDPEFFGLYQKSRGFIMEEPQKSKTSASNPARTQRKRTTRRRKKIPGVKPHITK